MKHWYSVAVFLLLVQLQVSAASVLFVTAYPNGAPCPIDAEICHNISYYFEQGNSLIKDNVIIIFLNGTHVIPSNGMKISQLNNITLQGDATNYITTPMLQCKKGFSEKQGTCVCIDKVKAVATCYSSTQSIERSGNEWIGYNIQQNCVIVSNLCPFDYCVIDSVNITNINNSNVQCTTNRTGQLCGGCIDGYSLVLGSNACKDCRGKNNRLSLIILFAVAGLALVVFLLFFNLTVSIGTINGLVFVANIGKHFQPYRLYHHNIPFFSQFFLWINLDLGIETCFYDGMNALQKTGLQFVFPLYLWLIITLIIVLSKYSQRIAKLVGNNGIPVLATLILLSYTKIIQTVFIIFSRTTVQCDNDTTVQWNVDPTQKYVSGGHIILFIIGVIVTALFIIPYTVFLLFYPLLQLSGEKCRQRLSWFLFKLKPFFDAYRGPHTNLFCIWPGVLLLVRIGFLLVSLSDNRKVTFAVILLVLVVLIAILSNGRVYKSKYLNVLDVCLLAMALVFTYSVSSGRGSNNQEDFNFTYGFGIYIFNIMLVFVVVLFYHTYKYTIIGEKIGKIMKKAKFNKESNHNFNKESALIKDDQADMPAYKMYDGGKLREPLLEDSTSIR